MKPATPSATVLNIQTSSSNSSQVLDQEFEQLETQFQIDDLHKETKETRREIGALKQNLQALQKAQSLENTFNPFSSHAIVYIDDVLIFSDSLEQHRKHLRAFLNTIKLNGLVDCPKEFLTGKTPIREPH